MVARCCVPGVLTLGLGAPLAAPPDRPQGLEWWHGQMDKVLQQGIDGWKLDGSVRCLARRTRNVRSPRLTAQGVRARARRALAQDPFIWLLFERAYGYAGRVRKANYSDLYYRTFVDHRCGRRVRRRTCAAAAR